MFKNLGELLLKEAGPHAGKTLKYLHSDSFEDGYPNWTGNLLEKFKEYRGYDATRICLCSEDGSLGAPRSPTVSFMTIARRWPIALLTAATEGLRSLRINEGMLLQSEAGGSFLVGHRLLRCAEESGPL